MKPTLKQRAALNLPLVKSSGQIILPLPPSTNNLFFNAGKRRVRTQEYDAWRTEAGLRLNRNGKWRIKGACEVTICLPTKMRGDIDNRVKPILDLLVSHDRIDDDRHISRIVVQRTWLMESDTCAVFVDGRA